VQVTSDNIHSIIWEGISLRHRHLRCPSPDLDGIRPLVPRPRFTIVIRDPDAVGKSIISMSRSEVQADNSPSRWPTLVANLPVLEISFFFGLFVCWPTLDAWSMILHQLEGEE
jgi:hypothetical protein